DKVKLNRSTAGPGSVFRCSMWKHTVKEEQSTGLQRCGHTAAAKDFGVTYLPVAALEMEIGAALPQFWEKLHAAVLDGGFIQCDPDPYDLGLERKAEIGVVLVPWLLSAQPRRFEKCEVGVHDDLIFADNAAHGPQQLGMISHSLQTRIKFDEVVQLP